MTDAEKVFNQTVQERKRIARGEKNKIKGGGGAVRLPSDNLTKKEREAMNGETVTYKVHSPVKWPEFKRWPPDIQREYFKRLDTSYRPTAEMYAAMFGVSKNSVSVLRASLGIKTGNRGRNLPDAAGWQRFTNRGGRRGRENIAGGSGTGNADDPQRMREICPRTGGADRRGTNRRNDPGANWHGRETDD
jgi:hypothetical protein